MRVHLVGWLTMAVLGVSPAFAQATFEDGTFLDADWEFVAWFAYDGASSQHGQRLSGGNPGAYRWMIHTLPEPTDPPPGPTLRTLHFFRDAVYDPHGDGPIVAIDYSEDDLLEDSTIDWGCVGARVAIRQDDRFYAAVDHTLDFGINAEEQCPDATSWVTRSATGLTETDFHELIPDLTDPDEPWWNPESHPDFSCGGSAITFGYLRLNSISVGTNVIEHGIDNWRVDVHPELPIPGPGVTRWIYSYLLHDGPANLAIDADDHIYVGNWNTGGDPSVPVHVYRINATDSTAAACGPVIDDPDAVYVDRNGIYHSPGDLLVGGYDHGTSMFQIARVSPACEIQGVERPSCIGNVSEFAEDAAGRLYAASGTQFTFCVHEDGTWRQFIPPVTDQPRIAIDSLDIYVSWGPSTGGTVHKYDTDGTLLDGSFTEGSVRAVGDWARRRQLVVARPNALIAVDVATGDETPILTGPESVAWDVEFDSRGDLYIARGDSCSRVLRVRWNDPVLGVGDSSPGAARAFVSAPSPNPTRGALRFRVQGSVRDLVYAQVFDVTGRAVGPPTFHRLTEGSRTLDLTAQELGPPDLASGVYFVQLRAGSEVATHRFVRSR